MNKTHLTNISFGITFLNLSIVGLCTLTFSCTFLTIVRLGALLCNLVMGVTLLFNNQSISTYNPLYKPYWLGMIVCNIIMVKMISPNCQSYGIMGLFIIGIIIVIVSLFSIGNSFAVTPMLSEIKTGFVYKIIRHPMYLGENLMIFSCSLASLTPISVAIFIGCGYFTVQRICIEERLLSNTNEYMEYCKDTPWKLIPYVW